MLIILRHQNTTEEQPKRTFLGMRGGGIIRAYLPFHPLPSDHTPLTYFLLL